MKHYIPLAAVAAVLALSACKQSEPEVVGGPQDPMSDALNNAAPIALPPSVKESHSYRCKDNSLLFVDFLSDDMTVHLRTEKTGTPVTLKAAEKGQPFEGEGGYKVEGGGSTITATLPGKAAVSCKA